ncbi:MAG: hypothetical protein AB1757_27620 [Acidobacteriota bacterium]
MFLSALLVGFIGLLAITSWIGLSLYSKRKPESVANHLKKVLCIACLAIGIPVIILIGIQTILNFSPDYVFASSFGFKPPAEVRELQGRKSAFFDSGDIYLRFKANKPILDKIVASKFFPIKEQFFNWPSPQHHPPDWWNPSDSKPKLFYQALNFNQEYSSNSAFLCYDETREIVYFYYIGID